MFVNTLAMRNQPGRDLSFREFLAQVKENALKAYENQDYPFEELVEQLKLKRDISRNPIFDVMIALQNTNNEGISGTGLTFAPYETGHRTAKFDLTLYVVESNEAIYLSMEYCRHLFRKETVERMVRHYQNIITEVTRAPELKLGEIEMLSGTELQQLLYEFNKTSAEYPRDKTIPQLFEEQVERTPANLAVVAEGVALTYRELNQRANQLARLLRQAGVRPNHIVGIMVDRSPEMVIGIMGILKAGGAYLPLDPNYPAARIQYMLTNSGTEIILTRKPFRAKLTGSGLKLIELESENYYPGGGANPKHHPKPNDLAYIIYTSGSTGPPKGVMIEHQALINRLNWMQKQYPLGETDVILQKTPYTFDVSLWEIFWWALYGAKVCLLKTGAEKDRPPS